MTETLTERRERQRQERLASIKKQRRKRVVEKALGGVGLVLGGALIAAVLIVLGAVVFQLVVWNLGVVGLVAACGGSVGKISLATAIGAVLLGAYVSQLLSGRIANLDLKK